MEGVNSILDMDSQQFSFDMSQLDSSDIVDMLVNPLSNNLSSGLSISDPVSNQI